MKAYVKPELRFESFVLSQTVATCGYHLGQGDINSCSVDEDRFSGGLANGAFANTTDNICGFQPDKYCYTNGASGFAKVFCS